MNKPNDKPSSRLWTGGAQEIAQPAEGELLQKPRKPALPADRLYVPFSPHEQPHALEIIRAAAPSRFPSYSYLLDISYDHHLQSAFSLVYTFMTVDVTGCDLAPIVHAINARRCATIRQFTAKLYDQPSVGEPIIENIEITSADESRKRGDKSKADR